MDGECVSGESVEWWVERERSGGRGWMERLEGEDRSVGAKESEGSFSFLGSSA